MTLKIWLCAALVGASLVGCSLDLKAAADVMTAELDQEFTLSGGQAATIRSENLRLRFTDILEDSRCPTQVECFWTGQARIALEITPTEHAPTVVEFNTNPAPGQNIQTVQVGEYTIVLRSLEPYPETIEQSISLDEYRATLSVTAAQ